MITGEELRKPGGGLASLPVPISTPGFDSAPYLTATLCITKDPETGVRNMGTYRARAEERQTGWACGWRRDSAAPEAICTG